jgi:hypothetical protein
MRVRDDGSVQPSNLPTHQNAGRQEDYGLYRCMVTKVLFVDDPQNVTANASNPRVLYECVVLGGFASGQVISNCRLSSDLGGNFNFYERTLRAASKNVSKTRLSDQDGDIVFVQFVQGHSGFPVIVALDQGISTGASTGAKVSDGQIVNWQYNGINAKIDKTGNLTLTRKGGSYDEDAKVFTPAANGQKIKVNLSGQKITMTMGNGLVVTIDGDTDKVSINTKGGASAILSGGSVTLKDSGSGELKISGSKVALGASSAELLQQISDALDKIATFLNSSDSTHTHMGNLGFPTSPPVPATGFTTLASDLQTIKGKVDGIKGSL